MIACGAWACWGGQIQYCQTWWPGVSAVLRVRLARCCASTTTTTVDFCRFCFMSLPAVLGSKAPGGVLALVETRRESVSKWHRTRKYEPKKLAVSVPERTTRLQPCDIAPGFDCSFRDRTVKLGIHTGGGRDFDDCKAGRVFCCSMVSCWVPIGPESTGYS